MSQFPYSPCSQLVESNFGLRHIGSMEDTLEQMARSLVESGEYRVTSPDAAAKGLVIGSNQLLAIGCHHPRAVPPAGSATITSIGRG